MPESTRPESPTEATPPASPLDRAFAALIGWNWGDDAAPLDPIDQAVVEAHGDPRLAADLETRLAAVLGAGTSRAATEFACRRLSRVGTARSVPALAGLLPDPEGSHMARFALERIPAPEAAEALRAALTSLDGPLQIGMISSLATRRDRASVPLLAALLARESTGPAAAYALASIGTPEAVAVLAETAACPTTATGAAVADALLTCAERLWRDGDHDRALQIARGVSAAAAGKPRARGIEHAATRTILACLDAARSVAAPLLLALALLLGGGAVAALPNDAVEMACQLVAGDDAAARAIGLDHVRYGTPNAEATRRFAQLLPTLPPVRQAELLAALADRGDAAALPEARAVLARDGATTVRAAALGLLGRAGGAAEVPLLVRSLDAADPERAAARRALVVIRGADAAAAIRAAALPSGPAAVFGILAERRDREALPDFVAATVAGSEEAWPEAAPAVERFGGIAEVGPLSEALVALPSGPRRDAIERALIAVCGRDPAAFEALVTRFRSLSPASQGPLVPVLGRVGGSAAREILQRMAADADPRQQRLALEALGHWPDASVADMLLERLAKGVDDDEAEILLRGLIRIAPRPDNGLSEPARLELLRRVMDLCRTDPQRARVVERAHAIRTLESLQFVLPYLDDSALASAASLSVVELAHHRKLREDHQREFMAALDRVITLGRDPEHVARAEAYKAGKTWERRN